MISDVGGRLLRIAYVVLYPALTVFPPPLRLIWRLCTRAPVRTLLAICIFCLLWVAIGLLLLPSQIAGCAISHTCTNLESPVNCISRPPLDISDLPSTANILEEYERLKSLEAAVIDMRIVLSQDFRSAIERTERTHALLNPVPTMHELLNARLLLEQLSTSVDNAHNIASQHYVRVRVELASLASGIQDAQDLLVELLQRSILKLEEVEGDAREASQSLRAVEKPDFALYTTGGITLRSHTSPSVDSSLAFKPEGSDMAIHHDVSPGYCWPFSGSHGHLAVQLPRPVIIDEVAIDHPRNHWDLSPAPRYMELWALVRDPEAVQATSAWAVNGDHVPSEGVRSIFGEDRYLRIARFEYDLRVAEVTQSFPVDEGFAKLSVPVQTVFLLITDNWGNQEYTCIYRFRVHGHLQDDLDTDFRDLGTSTD